MSSRPPRRRRRPNLSEQTANAIEALSQGQTEWGMEYNDWRSRDHPPGYVYQLYLVYVNPNRSRSDKSPPTGTVYTIRDGLFNTPQELIDYVNSDGFDNEVEQEEAGGAQYLTSIVYALRQDARIVPGRRGRYE